MSEQESLDLGKVVSLIMENPALIEQISALAKQSTPQTEEKQDNQERITDQAASQDDVLKPTYSPLQGSKSTRSQLLGALKPYLSQQRAKAIDSMISIVEIMDMMKGR